MRLPFLQSKTASAERARPVAAADPSTLVEAARTRARRRLVGALVLLVIGVVGFPIVFETQPRPLPVDTPIVASPAASPRPATPATPATTAPARPAPAAVRPVTEVAADPPAAPPVLPVITERTEPPAQAPAPGDAAVAASSPASAASAAAGSGRYVVQVGAYTDAATLREARAKVEKLGLKTYTQVINSDSGQRTRVRLGPYATRDEADAAAAKLKRAGLPANILAL